MSAISIRPVEQEDLDHFFSHEQDMEAQKMAAFIPENFGDRDVFDSHWRRILEMETVVARTILHEGGVCGHIIKFEIEGEAEVTYWIDKVCWGRGIATKALSLLLKEVDQRPIFGRTAFDNIASQRVLEKNGFTKVGEEEGFANARGRKIREFVFRLDQG